MRILIILNQKRIISEKTLIKYEGFFFLFFLFLFLIQPEAIIIYFGIGFSIVVLLILPWLIEIQHKNEFRNKSIEAIDAIILAMRSGKSFRESLTLIKNENFGHLFFELAQNILLRQPPKEMKSHFELNRIYKELLECEQTNFRVIEKLKSFRYGLSVEQRFRKKSAQAVLQTRAQSTILSLIYIGTFIFVIFQGKVLENLTIVLFSLVLFLVGTIWIWNMGKRHQWKV